MESIANITTNGRNLRREADVAMQKAKLLAVYNFFLVQRPPWPHSERALRERCARALERRGLALPYLGTWSERLLTWVRDEPGTIAIPFARRAVETYRHLEAEYGFPEKG